LKHKVHYRKGIGSPLQKRIGRIKLKEEKRKAEESSSIKTSTGMIYWHLYECIVLLGILVP